MRPAFVAFGSAFVILAAGLAVSAAETGNTAASLKPAASFSAITDTTQRSVALFAEAGKVITHPRCVNCHPAGDRPMQGSDSHPHRPLVVRGEDGLGAIGMRCTTCHGPANFDAARIPGHPLWHVAPVEMAWAGKSLGQICEQIKDPKRNGGKTMPQLIAHMSEDTLVGWGWNPGAGREPVPGTQKEFGDLIKAWVESGAACPSS